MTPWLRTPALRRAVEAVIVGAVCLWLSPMDARTVFAAASEYVRTPNFGPYDRLVFSQLHQRPFEQCPGVDALHAQAVERVGRALPQIEADTRFEPLRVVRLIRVFNQESQAFFRSECAQPWTYYHSYADYQSWLMKVAPVVWLIEVWHGSEIYPVVLLIPGSWFGIFCLFWTTKRLSGSSAAGFASLAILAFSLSAYGPRWFAPSRAGPTLEYADFRLNLFTTFAVVGLAQFLCDLPSSGSRRRVWALELSAAVLFALYAFSSLFLRLPPTKLDATVAMGCVFAVAAIRRDRAVLRRALLLLVLVTALQWPYQQFAARLLGPVSAVNSAASDEFKLVSVAQFLNERPTHFGNFILDFNFTWVHDGDYYLRRLSPVFTFHHGYPVWGRRFLRETALWHPTEIPNAWWKRFATQLIFHKELSYGIYGAHPALGTAVLFLASMLGAVILLGGRRAASAWPLMGLVFWEVFGLHTFLALMHVHYMYLLKGIPMLWCALPCLAALAVREVRTWRRPFLRPHSWPVRRPPVVALAAASVVVVVAAGWFVRELRKEIHATHVWRAVHAALIQRDAFLTPDALVREIDAIRDLGGDGPGTVSMYGAWALFGYLERHPSYTELTGQAIDAGQAKRLMFQLYKRALVEGPDNPHLYTYARYFSDPDWPAVFVEALRRFPDHPYRVMLSWALATEASNIPDEARAHYREVYDTSVRASLHDSESFRPGFRLRPSVTAASSVTATADGTVVTARPGETVSVEPFSTYGTDRLALGLYLHVLEGEVGGQLVDAHGNHIGDVPAMYPGDHFPYRAWHFDHLVGAPPDRNRGEDDRQARLTLVAGPRGGRFVIRDLYPLIENPRWFR